MVADLREKLCEMTSLCVKAFRLQAVTALGKKNSAAYETRPSCLNTSAETPCPASKKGSDFVDLLGVNRHMAEAHSDRGSNIDMDFKELAEYTQSPPKLDLSAAQKTIGRTTPSSSSLDVLPSNESSIVDRFVQNT